MICFCPLKKRILNMNKTAISRANLEDAIDAAYAGLEQLALEWDSKCPEFWAEMWLNVLMKNRTLDEWPNNELPVLYNRLLDWEEYDGACPWYPLLEYGQTDRERDAHRARWAELVHEALAIYDISKYDFDESVMAAAEPDNHELAEDYVKAMAVNIALEHRLSKAQARIRQLEEGTRERRLRREAARLGLKLKRARTRCEQSPEYGTYRIVDANTNHVPDKL